MLPVIHLFLLSQSFLIFEAQAAPAVADPALLSLNTIPVSNISTTLSLGEDTLYSLATFLNTSNLADIVLYRVPGTHTTLRIAVQDPAIKKWNLGRTILRTQQSLSEYIKRHDAEDNPLTIHDDPYESDARYSGCFFGVATFPIGYHHLTYGIVMNVLQGMWLYLYRGDRFQTAVFEVRDDQFGTVGIGKITPERPDGRVLLGTEIGEWNGSAV